jgi:23S rRNA (cytidine2498-2'-O)-methyltransferase
MKSEFSCWVCAIEWEETLVREIKSRVESARPFVASHGVVLCPPLSALPKSADAGPELKGHQTHEGHAAHAAPGAPDGCNTHGPEDSGADGVAEEVQLTAQEWVFARQTLPNTCEIKGQSVQDLVREMGALVDATLDYNPFPWTIRICTPDAFTEDSTVYHQTGPRASLLETQFLERMATFRKRAFDRYIPWKNAGSTNVRILLQGLLLSPRRLLLSVAQSRDFSVPTWKTAFWKTNPGLVPHDQKAPCRSYYKIEEAWVRSGIRPRAGEVCVDLGAAPGGWTWAALKSGARVISVDAADLVGHVAKHEACEHLRDNGYVFQPPKRVDWMFCDMIVKPMATLGLLERWLEEKLCKNFVVNVKFRGRDPSDILTAIERLRHTYHLKPLAIKHLFADRNEITLTGRVATV